MAGVNGFAEFPLPLAHGTGLTQSPTDTCAHLISQLLDTFSNRFYLEAGRPKHWFSYLFLSFCLDCSAEMIIVEGIKLESSKIYPTAIQTASKKQYFIQKRIPKERAIIKGLRVQVMKTITQFLD
jgi:hypothetical protein